ncbi:MAG: FapA family protein [Desulfobacterales bacterium]|nr:FapA family protein [Desulfobacterales bacterium]
MLEKIALQKNLITREQCAQALKACQGSKNIELALKDYFLSQGLIPVPQMKQVITTFQTLKVMRKNTIFGTIAVKLGFVDKAVFQEEIARQKKAAGTKGVPTFIGEIWLKNSTLTKEQYLKILRIQEKKPGGSPKPKPVQPPAPEKTAEVSQEAQAPKEKPPKEETVEDKPQEEKDHSIKKELECGVTLEIDHTGMNAFITKTDKFDDSLSATELSDLLGDEGIFYGLVREEQLHGFIRSSGFKTKPFQVATGKPPVEGKDARIEYYFDTDHLKAGGFDDEGNIDFKDRGAIPWVEEGALLVERFPMVPAHNGTNIFDQMVEVPVVTDIPLRYKTGVVPSEDDQRLYAEISGHPRLTWSGNVQVSDVFLVKENVNYETGHLDYAGNIDIKGTLKSGFRVKGDTIRINTVDGGEIYAEGDVTVTNGINDATIYARGNVTAKFIQNSKILCLGNVTTHKEIVDTTIETSGAVIIPNGEVIASDITANMGLTARHLGTDKSVPNTVTMGVDAFTAKEVKSISKIIRRNEKQIEEIREKITALERDIQALHQSTGRLAYEMDLARDEGIHLDEKMAGEKEGSQTAGILKSQVQKNKALFARLDADLNKYFDRIEKNETRIMEMEVTQGELADELEDRQYELANFTEWQEINPGIAEITVTGRVTAATLIKGPHATREIPEPLANVKIKELMSTKKGEEGYQIQIHENFKR